MSSMKIKGHYKWELETLREKEKEDCKKIEIKISFHKEKLNEKEEKNE